MVVCCNIDASAPVWALEVVSQGATMACLVTAVLAAIAGVVHGVTGFGAGIVIMLGLPFFYPVVESAGMVGPMCMVLCGSMAWRYREYVDPRKALLPALLYVAVCSATINFASMVPQAEAKRALGVFLIALAAYYLLFDKSKEGRELSLPLQVACVVISAICDGLFGIGGPLMVVYFMASTKSMQEYLGTLQLFFFATVLYNTAFRIYKGIIGPEHLLPIAVGTVSILGGLWVANRLVDRLDADVVRKLTYVMIGVAGLINLIG